MVSTNVPKRIAKFEIFKYFAIVSHFSSAWLCQQSYCRVHGTGVSSIYPSVRPPFNSSFSETTAWIQTKFMRSYLSAITPHSFFSFSIFFSFPLAFRDKHFIKNAAPTILALIDYVSRAHESKFVRRPSSVFRPCRNYLRTYCAESFQISLVASPGAEPGWKWTLLKKKSHF